VIEMITPFTVMSYTIFKKGLIKLITNARI
jgi:hypothetical protein